MSVFENADEEIEYLSKIISSTKKEDTLRLRTVGLRLVELSFNTEYVNGGNVAQDRINQFNKIIRNVCTELGLTYAGVDLDNDEIVEAIKKLKT
ncbi:hypothetical protein KAR91_48060 [Candidatus Pacearchaeota archaeon]|nr:hypothetical protein [Candidatus Pacearchaeota archaeon]